MIMVMMMMMLPQYWHSYGDIDYNDDDKDD